MAPEEVDYILFSFFALRSVLIFMRKDGAKPYHMVIDGVEPERVFAITRKYCHKYGLAWRVAA